MKDFSLASKPKAATFSADHLNSLSEIELLELRGKIDTILQIQIGDLNLGEELSLQLRKAKSLFDKVSEDKNTPVNQQAQLFNSIQALIDKLIKSRKIVFSQERLRRYEVAMLAALETLQNTAAKEAFLDLYQEYLEQRGE